MISLKKLLSDIALLHSGEWRGMLDPTDFSFFTVSVTIPERDRRRAPASHCFAVPNKRQQTVVLIKMRKIGVRYIGDFTSLYSNFLKNTSFSMFLLECLFVLILFITNNIGE